MTTDWSRALMHIDGDAFFASVYQAIHPSTKGKPLVIGRERGIATAISYEAKAYGVKRGMLMHEIKKLCPQCIIASSDYRLYEMFSQKMMDIIRSYTPYVERYSIDEAFADITDLKNTMCMDYSSIGKHIKKTIEISLGISVSVGIAPTKSLAKIGSSYQKPSGCITINDINKDIFLKNTKIENVWGIGWRTAPKMKTLGLESAYDFVHEQEKIITKLFNKPIVEIWNELQGNQIYQLNTAKTITYQSISKTHTVTPATMDKNILFVRLMEYIEDAFTKARRYDYQVGRMSIFLKTQQFRYYATEIRLPEKTQYPFLIRKDVRKGFDKIYHQHTLYRASGCTLYDLEKTTESQPMLFHATADIEEKLKHLYPLFEENKIKFGISLFDKRRDMRRKKFLFPTIKLDS